MCNLHGPFKGLWDIKALLKRKTKNSYSIKSLWKIAKYKKFSVIIGNRLNFSNHISEFCKKPSQKIAALSRLFSYLRNSEKKLIFNSIIKSQFSYCPLVCMFCQRRSNNMINKLHEMSLRVTLNDYLSNFNILLKNNNDICNNQKNRLVWSWNRQLPLSSSLVPSARKPQRNDLIKPIQKKY